MDDALVQLLRVLEQQRTTHSSLYSLADSAHAGLGSSAPLAAQLLLGSHGVLSESERLSAIAVASVAPSTSPPLTGSSCLHSHRERCLASACKNCDPSILSQHPSSLATGDSDSTLFSYPASDPASSSSSMCVIPAAVHAPLGLSWHFDDRERAVRAFGEVLLPECNPSPPPVHLYHSEPIWPLLPIVRRPLTLSSPINPDEAEQQMLSLARASTQQLLPQEASNLLDVLNSMPTIVERSGLKATLLHSMIERNSEVTAETVRAASQCSEQCRAAWTGSLQSATPSVHSMEAAGRLLHEAKVECSALASLALTCLQVLTQGNERESKLAAELAREAVLSGCINDTDELAQLQALSLELVHMQEGAQLYSLVASKTTERHEEMKGAEDSN